jgi:hypothetical protein
VITLYARETVEDLEMQEAAGLLSEGDTDIERIGLAFQIATRRTAWVAVSEEPTVDPTAPIRRERIPHELPYGMSAEGLGLRQPSGSAGSVIVLSLGDPAAEPVEPSSRLLTARLTFRKNRHLVLEVDVTDPVEWYPRDVKVIWVDGSEVAAVIAESTTRPGVVEAGQVIRLVLRLSGDGRSDAPVRVDLMSRGRTFHLMLSR